MGPVLAATLPISFTWRGLCRSSGEVARCAIKFICRILKVVSHGEKLGSAVLVLLLFFPPSKWADLEIRHAPRALQVVETKSFKDVFYLPWDKWKNLHEINFDFMFVCVVTTGVTHTRPFGALQCDNRGLSALQARFNSQTASPVLLLSGYQSCWRQGWHQERTSLFL